MGLSVKTDMGGGKSTSMSRLVRARLGRIPAPPVALPDIRYEAEAIAAWLHRQEGPQRRPEQTAKILALAVRLHLDGVKPWPVRRQVAAHTGVSLPMLDVVMSQRQASGDISVWTATVKGNIAKHDSVVTQKFVQPSQELIKIGKQAMSQRTKDEKKAIRRERDAERRNAQRDVQRRAVALKSDSD